MSKYKLLIMSFTDASRDPRMHRQLSYLADLFDISVVATAPPTNKELPFFPVRYAKAPGINEKMYRAYAAAHGNYLRYLKRYYIQGMDALESTHFDVIIVNDALPIPFAFHIAKDAPVIFDAHEFYPRQADNSVFWNTFFRKMFENICKDYIKQFYSVTTVSRQMADAYHAEYGVTPEIVYSAPPYENLHPTPVDPQHIRIIHHGGVSRQRKIEDMIKMMDLLDERYTLDLMLIGKKTRYFSGLRSTAEKHKNIRWREPVKMQALAQETNDYDIGLFIMPPTTFNLSCTIPNKFFEFIQARLAVAIGPSAGMSAIAREFGLGIIAEDFTPRSMALKLNALSSSDIYEMKQHSDTAAKKYNAESCMQTMREIAIRAATHHSA